MLMQVELLEEQPKILIVDDEEGARESLEVLLEDLYSIESVEDGMAALEKIQKNDYDVVLLDVNMPKLNGIEILKRIKSYNETIHVIMVSAADRAREATASIKCGALDYITKPYEPEAILATIEGALRNKPREGAACSPQPNEVFHFGDLQIVSRSRRMHAIFKMIGKIAKASSNVLITGESGTGKELIARAIHASSNRADKPFVAINCAAIPPELVESELFGHEKGAFTGAHIRSIGKFEFAHGGTIFLDEISSLRLELQAKLLRVLQEREFCRVGSHQLVKVNIRVIAATNTRLDEMVKHDRFRSDLYFRLNVIPINLPPLRQRKEDIPLLANYFLSKFNTSLQKRVGAISRDAMDVLEAYPWPGNVRELENIIERLVVLGSNDVCVDESQLPFDLLIRGESRGEAAGAETCKDIGLIQARQAFEKEYILRALARSQGNQSDAARRLKVHRNTLLQKMRALGIKGSNDM